MSASSLSPQFSGMLRSMPIEEFGQFRSGDFPRRKMKSVTREILRKGGNLDDLKASIASEGIQQPLRVVGGVVDSGHHRYVAAKELGLTHIPVTVWKK